MYFSQPPIAVVVHCKKFFFLGGGGCVGYAIIPESVVRAVPLSGGHLPVTSINNEDTDPSNNSTCIVTNSEEVAERTKHSFLRGRL